MSDIEFDTEYTREPICPYCGHEQRDAWEIDFGGTEGDAEISCGECEREFIVSRSVTVDYTTKKKEEK